MTTPLSLPNNLFLSLGSNQGDRLYYLQQAVDLISDRMGDIYQISSVYETPAWGFQANHFLNAVLWVTTSLTPEAVIEQALNIEKKLGRTRTNQPGYQDRTLDVDILFYEDLIIHTPSLTIPHPRLHLRHFVLVPLQEIAPHWIHPEFNKSVKQLLEESAEESQITLTQWQLYTNSD